MDRSDPFNSLAEIALSSDLPLSDTTRKPNEPLLGCRRCPSMTSGAAEASCNRLIWRSSRRTMQAQGWQHFHSSSWLMLIEHSCRLVVRPTRTNGHQTRQLMKKWINRCPVTASLGRWVSCDSLHGATTPFYIQGFIDLRVHVHLTITNWRFLWSLHVKPHRILSGHSEKIEKSYKFSQKLETSGHQSNNSNYNNHQICYLF